MGFRINTNVAAMNAHRNSVNTNLGLDKSLNSLSSGLRINRAADDASGMVIADSLRSQAQGLGQAINNANDGVAVTQTADGALDEYMNILNTVRTKAIQASSDGQNSDSRAAIQEDINRLLEVADSIASTTQFNGQKLLDGSFTNKSFHIGAYAGETVDLSVKSVRTDAVGDIKGTTGGANRDPLENKNIIEGDTGFSLRANELTVNDTDIASSINSLTPKRLTDAASIAAAITKSTDLVAEGKNTLTAAASVTVAASGESTKIDSTNYLKINGINVPDVTVTADDADGALVRAINDISDQTGVTATLDENKKLVLTSNDGSNISISTRDNIDQDTVTLGGGNAAANDSFTISAAGGVAVTYTSTTAETAEEVRDGIIALLNQTDGFEAKAEVDANGNILLTGKDSGEISYTVSTNSTSATINTTDLDNLNSKALSGLTVDNLTNKSGTIDVVPEIQSTSAAPLVLEKGQLVINGKDMLGTYGDGSTLGSAGDALIAAIKSIDGMSDSTLTANGKLELVVNNGDDLNIAGTLAETVFGLEKGVSNESKVGSVEIYSDSPVKIGGSDPASFGFTAGTKGVSGQGRSLNDIDVTNRNSAEIAVLMADSALKQLDSTRADLGSVQNQLESTIRNISVTQVNVTAAESQIRDVDFASESANFAKLNILAQSGSYAMSQANAVQQNVMRLLQ